MKCHRDGEKKRYKFHFVAKVFRQFFGKDLYEIYFATTSLSTIAVFDMHG